VCVEIFIRDLREAYTLIVLHMGYAYVDIASL
jgi:hypothetical protein